MLQTVTVGSCVQVQGIFVRKLDNGRVVVSVGKQEIAGKPVGKLN